MELANVLNLLAHLFILCQVLGHIDSFPCHIDYHRYLAALTKVHIKLNLSILRYLQTVNCPHHLHIEVRRPFEKA